MAEYLIQDATLSAIGDAIRNKTGNTEAITPENMPTEIEGIKSGSDIITESLTVEENGIYTADEGKAYSPVTVSVPQTSIEPLTATENGTYTAESGKAFNPVVVDIPEQIKTLDSVPDTKVTDIIVVSGDYYLWKEGA